MSDAKPIRVLLVDDHAVVRSGLGAFLMVHNDLELVGEAENGKDAINKVGVLNPDVVLMDMIMPEMDGASATRIIRDKFPATQIIALTSFREDNLVQSALQAGAISYLLKNVTADDLAGAIRAAYAGRSTLSPEAAQVLIQAATRPQKPAVDLTERERDVLSLMVKGLSNSEIANKLVVSASTVKFHVSNILSKMGVSSRTEAVAHALQQHLVD